MADDIPDNVENISKPGRPGKVDVAAISNDYCSGTMSLREIGEKNGVSKTYVAKLVKKFGWEQNLTERVAKERDRQLAQAAAKERKLHEGSDGIISSAAELQASVILRHRGDIEKLAIISQQNIEKLRDSDNLKDRISLTDTAAKTLRTLTVMEREAHGIGKEIEDGQTSHESMVDWFKRNES